MRARTVEAVVAVPPVGTAPGRTQATAPAAAERRPQAADARSPGGRWEPDASDALVSIGEAAELLGTTTRTLRYYEQLGLVTPSRQSVSSQRRYGAAELDRLHQIRELQSLLGLDLDEIGEQLAAWDHLEELKAEYRSEPPAARQEEILAEGLPILESLRRRVADRQEQLAVFASHLDQRIERYHTAIAGR